MERSLSLSINANLERLRGACIGLLLAIIIVPFPLLGIEPGYSPTAAPWQESAYIAFSLLSGLVLGWTYRFRFPARKPIGAANAPRNETTTIKTSDGAELLISERIEPIALPTEPAKDKSGETEKKTSIVHLAGSSSKIFKLLSQLISPAVPYARALFFMLFFAAVALCQRLHMCMIPDTEPFVTIYRTTGLVVGAIAASLFLLVKAGRPVNRLGPRTVRRLATLMGFASAPLAFAVWLNLCALPGILVMMKWEDRSNAT